MFLDSVNGALKLKKVGFIFSNIQGFADNSSDYIWIRAVPIIRKVTLSSLHFLEILHYFQQNIALIQLQIPPTIHFILQSEACHGAIKFGDTLSLQECQGLISELVLCKYPFQCAHGRPSVATLCTLNDRVQKYKKENS